MLTQEEIKNYNSFWKDIIEKEDGTVDMEQLKKELYDYSMIIENCTKAYMEMTDGNISKPNTCFFEVKSIFEDKYAFAEDYNELETKVEQLENKVKELENVLDERFIHVAYARTVYGRLMQLPKEIIVKNDLKLRNEINMLLEEKNRQEQLNDKYLQKLVYALTPTTHALGNEYNNGFKKIIADNIDLETCKIRRKLKEYWGKDKY